MVGVAESNGEPTEGIRMDRRKFFVGARWGRRRSSGARRSNSTGGSPPDYAGPSVPPQGHLTLRRRSQRRRTLRQRRCRLHNGATTARDAVIGAVAIGVGVIGVHAVTGRRYSGPRYFYGPRR